MTKKLSDIEKLHRRMERLLMKAYHSAFVPIQSLTEGAEIINDALELTNEQKQPSANHCPICGKWIFPNPFSAHWWAGEPPIRHLDGTTNYCEGHST